LNAIKRAAFRKGAVTCAKRHNGLRILGYGTLDGMGARGLKLLLSSEPSDRGGSRAQALPRPSHLRVERIGDVVQIDEASSRR
jgi:hypothetical protein